MLKETLKKLDDAQPRYDMHMRGYEAAKILLKGEVFWTLRDGKTGAIQEEGHIPNIVTLDAGILVARLLKTPSAVPNVCEPNFGIFALAVGTGDGGWDPLDPPAATNTQRSLWNELARKQIASSDFIDSGGAISGIPTNIVDYTTTFSESEAVGALTEMGLLGGDVDTNMSITNPITPANGVYDDTVDVTGKDTLVNYLTFPVINKPATSTLTWTWRISA